MRRCGITASLNFTAVLCVVWLLSAAGCQRGTKAPVAAAPEVHGPELVFGGHPLSIPPVPCVSAVLIEPETNTILYEQNDHLRRAPASIVKMTLDLVVMRDIESGKLSLDDSVRTSTWASKIGGSQVYLKEGETFTLGQMLQAITIHSANDCCVAVAERVAGTADGFVQRMNEEAAALKLADTHYVNVHGLDDEPGEGNYTTAYDISQIARELIRYPKVLEWSSTIEAPFRNGQFILQNTNKLLGHFPGLDGLKTGYTRKAGFCLCATAQRDGVRLVSVILGADSNRNRFEDSARLLAAGFNAYTPVTIQKGEQAPADQAVREGVIPAVRPVADHEMTLLVSRPEDRQLKKVFVASSPVRAPLRKGQVIGALRIVSGDKVLAEVPAVAPEDVARAGFLRRVFRRR